MTTYNGIKILDKYFKNRTVSDILNVDNRYQEMILEKLISWTKDNDTTTISILRLHKKQLSDTKFNGILNINLNKNEILRIGILKIYGNPEFANIPNFMKFKSKF